MAISLKLAASTLALAAAGCGSESPVEHTNAVTTQQLHDISRNTSEFDGAAESVAPSTPDELGQSMRAGAATKPKAH